MGEPGQTARSVALRALLQMGENAGYSNIVLDKALSSGGLSSRDRALASTIFYGVLERRLTLDFYLRQCLKNPGQKLEPAAQEALRCGAYQILYLDRVPDSAAVNETVNAVKQIGKNRLSGLVNGVLRGLLRKKDEIHLPQDNGISSLSLRYSVPPGLIGLWKKAYGEPVLLRLLDSMMEKPQMYVRVNRTRQEESFGALLEEENVKFSPLPEPPGAGTLIGCGTPSELSAFQQGYCHVQDLSAQWVCRILDPRPGETVCDCCAAPGGKTFTIAQEVGEKGKVYAFDLYEGRVGLIRKGAKRLGLENIEAMVGDATEAHMPPADKVLCDVPCSGFGVIRRKPEIRYKDLDAIRDLPELQYKILCQGAKSVKPGGLLVYATCTLNPKENQRVAERFLQENSGYKPMNIDVGIERSIPEPAYMLTMMPFAGASDGFFAAAFQKKEE